MGSDHCISESAVLYSYLDTRMVGAIMNRERAEKIFPAYFQSIELPSEAIGQEIAVYRACPTRKIERASFLNSYEENNFRVPPDMDAGDPQQYSLSTYKNIKDIRRFVVIDSRYQPPWLLAKGHTTCEDGLSCETKAWKKGYRGSHVDWWLYEGAEPWAVFKEAVYDEERISK